MSVREINVLGKGVSLTEISINEYGYSWEDIDDVLAEIEKMNLTILGGDVYIFGDKGLMLTFDNWYYSLLDVPLDSALSVDKAREYIHNYIEKMGKITIFL